MRITLTRNELIVLAFALATLITLAIAPAVAFGEDSGAGSQPQTASAAMTAGQQLTIEGIVIRRDPDTFTLREANGTETVVVLTETTSVKTVRKGLFRRDRISGVGYILRGLRLKAGGTVNSDGQLVAINIRFYEEDLRTAQALESRVDPVEKQANSTQALAESNQQRISEVEKNAQKLSGQFDELSTVANGARVAASNAQATVDQAVWDANTANQQIKGLDEYEVVDSFTVYFDSGSDLLSAEAKRELDETAASVESQDLKGWMVAVVGYTDSTGKSEKNRAISEKRANAVIQYLVIRHNLPQRRLVQPFGYGSAKPVASNDTSQGRAMNRRADIRVLVNKGVSSQSNSQRTTSGYQSSRQP